MDERDSNRLDPAWLDTVLTGIADAVLATDLDGRVVFLNRAAEQFTGWPLAEARGEHVTRVFRAIEECTGEAHRCTVTVGMDPRRRVTLPGSCLLLSKAGVRIPIEQKTSPLRDGSGRIAGEVIIFRNITERKRAEQRLRDASQRTRNILEGIADGFVAIDPEWRFTYFNAAFERMTGLMREQVLGRSLWEIFPELNGTIVEESMKRALSEQAMVECEHEYKPRDRWFLERYYPSNEGGLTVFVTDITERKRNEQAIVELNHKLHRRIRVLQTVLDTAPVGVNVAQDPRCKVISSNKALAEMLGMPHGENVSKSRDDADKVPYRVFKDGVELPADELPMQRAARDVTIEGEVLEIVRGDGSRITAMMNARPIRDDSGAILGAVGICVDVTTIRAAEEALRRADRLKDEFLATLAHELRNPLGTIANAAQLLKMGPGAENLAWVNGVLDRQIGQLGRLIDDLLDVSRIGSGKLELKKQTLDASLVLAQALDSVRPLIKERGHGLDVLLTTGEAWVHVDPVRLQQVIVNLLVNAAKYTPRGGRIWLAADSDGQSVSISVRDDGVGIPPERLPEMFELFAQGESSPACSGGGLGIGLTIVKSLVELHGGTITARSEGSGKGSEFVVRLPAATPALTPRQEAGPASRKSSRGRRVLVVDDNPDAVESMERLLRLEGHQVAVARSGRQALEMARESKPEVILLDIGLPELSGYEVAEKLRGEAEFEDTLIVAVSGYAQDEDRRKSARAGFNHHFAKPIHPETLATLLSR
jgi:PAS domain S-box-containing protein